MTDSAKQALLSVIGRFAPVELVQQLRFEVGLRAKARLWRLARTPRSMIERLARQGEVRVNLGCGPLPTRGWLNVDGISPQADLLQVFGERLGLPDACAAMAFSEHVLEHIDYPDRARCFLAETYRILRPGGHFRVIVPDAGRALRLYATGDTAGLREMSDWGDLPIEMVNRIFREGGFHRWAWDYDLLERELKAAGFEHVRLASFRDSEVEDLNIDFDDPSRICQSLYVEATK